MLFIVNKTAAAGKCEDLFMQARRYLDECKAKYSVRYTEKRGHAAELAREAADNGEKEIIAVGGDGTVRETVQALLGRDIKLGILPFGTGNDFVKPLHIPVNPVQAAKCILAGHSIPTDICRANDKLFVNIAGLGFDVDTLVETERYKSKFHGMMPYFLGILSALVHKRAIKLKITADDEVREGEYLLTDVANGTHFGGGMKVAPDADMHDGLFDVVLIKNVGTLKFLSLLPGFISGKHIKHPEVVEVLRARSVRIEAAEGEEYPVQEDGEPCDVTPVLFEILHNAIRITVPEEI